MGFCILLTLTSCSDDLDDTGVEFHPGKDVMEIFVDTLANVKAYSVLAERKFSEWSDSKGLLGHIKDPILGDYKSSTLGIATPRDVYMKFEDSVAYTSLKLCVGYRVNSGKSANDLKVNVYELLKESDTYLDDLTGMPDNEKSLKKLWDGSGFVTTLTLADIDEDENQTANYVWFDMLSTGIGEDLARRLIATDSIYNYGSGYSHAELMHERFFKGFYFQTLNSEEGTSMFQLNDDSTRLELGLDIFLYDTSANRYDTIHEVIRFNLFGYGRKNVFEREYRPEIERNIYDTLYEPSVSEIDSVFYLHAMNGISGRIVISDLDSVFNFSDFQKVNQAELVLQLADYDSYGVEDYPPINDIQIFVNGTPNRYVADYWRGTTTNYGGISLVSESNVFPINLTSHINNMIDNGEDRLVLDIVPYYKSEISNRSVFRSSENSNFRVQLRITYTKFNFN